MKHISISILLFAAFIGCKKEINVDLQNASPQIVIEAIVTNAAYTEVTVSKSVAFSSSNTYPRVSGAVVNISDNGANYILTETRPGTYSNSSLIGIPGHIYNLSVKVEGKEYTSASTMPLQVKLDSLLLEKLFWGNESIWVVKPQYTDPAGFGHHYMFVETINGKQYPQFWVWDDRIVNNSISTIPLIQSDSTVNVNDIIEVEMRCIDKNVFRYFTALQGSQNNATTPANPENTITGGALGYFSAHTTEKKKVKVQ
ncbi:MAG: hypothetical protein JWR72_2723 [Flavisolibacter sp.]|jgi:hypothetical protein|nr:hypothetical protein [Flavisolibacter sp.]